MPSGRVAKNGLPPTNCSLSICICSSMHPLSTSLSFRIQHVLWIRSSFMLASSFMFLISSLLSLSIFVMFILNAYSFNPFVLFPLVQENRFFCLLPFFYNSYPPQTSHYFPLWTHVSLEPPMNLAWRCVLGQSESLCVAVWKQPLPLLSPNQAIFFLSKSSRTSSPDIALFQGLPPSCNSLSLERGNI